MKIKIARPEFFEIKRKYNLIFIWILLIAPDPISGKNLVNFIVSVGNQIIKNKNKPYIYKLFLTKRRILCLVKLLKKL